MFSNLTISFSFWIFRFHFFSLLSVSFSVFIIWVYNYIGYNIIFYSEFELAKHLLRAEWYFDGGIHADVKTLVVNTNKHVMLNYKLQNADCITNSMAPYVQHCLIPNSNLMFFGVFNIIFDVVVVHIFFCCSPIYFCAIRLGNSLHLNGE